MRQVQPLEVVYRALEESPYLHAQLVHLIVREVEGRDFLDGHQGDDFFVEIVGDTIVLEAD